MSAIRKLKSNRYQLDFVLFGHRVRTNFLNESHAAYFRERLFALIPERTVTIDLAIATYLKNETDKRKSPRSRLAERLWFFELRSFLRDQHNLREDALINDVTRFHLESFQAHLRTHGSINGERLKASSINRRFNSVKNFFKKAHDWNLVVENRARPIAKLPEELSRKVLWTPQEIERAAGEPALTLIVTQLIRFLNHTGVRLSGALDIKKSEVNLDERTIIVRHRKGNGQEISYIIPIPAQIFEMVRLRVLAGPGALLFSEDGSRLTSYCIGKRFGRYARENELGHLSLGGLRHTFATRLNGAGVSMETIRLLLGHRSLKTTQNYLHTKLEELRKAVD